jgi:hypothetical protein
MNKFALAFAVATVFSIAPAFAADKLACDDAGMKKVEMMLKEKMEMKVDATMAMKQNEKAAMAMKAGDNEDCAMHLNMAQEELMKAN